MSVKRFEDLIAWQKARVFTREIYRVTQTPPFSLDRGLSSQIQRASVSIMSNIAEGFDRNSPADFHRFLVMAKASCAEVRCQLYIALDIDYVSQTEFQALMAQAVELAKIISGLRSSVEKQIKR